MIFFIHGPDTYRANQYLHKMIAKFKADRDPAGYNTVVLDCLNTDEAAQVLEQIYAAPFLAEKRLVAVKQLISLGGHELKAELTERIQAGTIPATTVLVIVESEEKFRAKADKALLELLQQEKYKEYFGELSATELPTWIKQELKARAVTIEPAALGYWSLNAPAERWELAHQIEQLSAYKAGGSITQADVEQFVPAKVDDNIFTLVDAIVAGKHQAAYAMIREQYRNGKDSFYVFAMVLRQFRILLEITDALERGLTPDAKAMGLHPFVVKKTLPVAKRYSLPALKKIYAQLLDIDLQTKTGGGSHAVLIDIFVSKQ